MKRKFFATLLCLLMMATLLPMGSAVTHAAGTSILSNGDFENGLENWTKSKGEDGQIIREADTPAAGISAVSPLSGSAFKIEGNTDYYQELAGLVEGRSYVVEGYINAPVNNQGPRVFVGRGTHNPSGGTYVDEVYNLYTYAATTGADTTTNGWLKFAESFVYAPSKNDPSGDGKWSLVLRNTNSNPVYFDEIKVYPLDENVIVYEPFDTFIKDHALGFDYNKSSFVSETGVLGEIGFLTEDGVCNGVWKTKKSDKSAYRTSLSITKLSTLCNSGDVLHVSFRAKNIEGGTQSTAPYVGVQHANNISGSNTVGYSSPRGIKGADLTLNNGDWVNYDFWFVCDSTIWEKLVFYTGQTDGWYMDDLIISVAEGAFVGDGKTLSNTKTDFTSNSKDFTMQKRVSLDGAYTIDEEVAPFVRFTATEEATSAMTFSAVYKNEGSKRQLLHWITETLDATAPESAESIDLSLLELTEEADVTYTVETSAWEMDSMKPMVKKVSTPITFASETPVSYSNYDIIKEVAYAFDRQGAQIPYDQLNARRSIYASPEDATAQRTIFLDCSSFINACYREAFGVNIMPYEISEAAGTSPQTGNIDTYAKENQSADDVIGYWEPQTYTTDAARQEVADWIKENIEIGDVVTYRHGENEATKGHMYMYIGLDNSGRKIFIHCGGAGSFTVNESDPGLSYDNNASEIESNGTIATIVFSSIFENAESARYIFKATESDTVWSFSIIRPMARNLTPTDEAINRMKIAGISMEKTSSVWENASVKTGDILTYTVTMENTNKTALSGVKITDTIPAGTEFVSGDTGVSASGSSISWRGNIPASSTVTVNYSVKITADTPGTLIKSDKTYVSGVKLSNITHTVSGFSEAQYTSIAEAAISCASEAKTYTNGIELAKDIYNSALGVNIFEYATPTAALDDLIDEENLTRSTTTDISKMIAPNLYGGLDIRYGRLYFPAENDRTSLPMEQHLSVGDIILADWEGGSVAFVYAGNKTLVTVGDDGESKTLTIGDNIYGEGQDNIIISLLGYDRYAVLRPSMTINASQANVANN